MKTSECGYGFYEKNLLFLCKPDPDAHRPYDQGLKPQDSFQNKRWSNSVEEKILRIQTLAKSGGGGNREKLLTSSCALSEYFKTGAHFWRVKVSMVETASDIWIFKQRKLSDWVSGDISSIEKSVSKQEAGRKLWSHGGRRGRNGKGTMLQPPLWLSELPAGTQTWRAGSLLLTQYCLQLEGNFLDRQHRKELYFLFQRYKFNSTKADFLPRGSWSSLALIWLTSINTDMNNQRVMCSSRGVTCQHMFLSVCEAAMCGLI